MWFVQFVLACKDTVNDFLGSNCPQLAAAISFYALFSLFPLALALASVLGFFLGSPAAEAELVRVISKLAPASSELITEALGGVVRTRTIIGVIGILGLLGTSSAVFGTIRKGINAAWGIRQTRPFLQERLIDFSLVLGAGLLLMISVSATAVVQFLQDTTRLVLPGMPLVQSILWGSAGAMAPAAVSFSVFLVLYRFLPNTRVSFRHVWPGALIAAIGFEIAKNAFVWYVGTFSTYNLIYGPVGAIIALLAWLYISALVLLFGAVVTARYASHLSKKAEAAGVQLVNGLRSRMRTLEVRLHE